MNDANPRWQQQQAEGGPDDERDPYARDPYYQQQSYGYDPYAQPQQAPPHIPQQGYQEPYYGDPSQTYAGQQEQGWIPQQPRQPYYDQNGGYGTGQQPAYDTGQQQAYDTGQHAVYDTGQHAVYETGQQQPVYDTGQQQAYDTGQQPVYDTGQHAVYETGQQQAYDTGQQPVYDTGQHTVYGTGQFAAVQDTGQQPVQEAPAAGAPKGNGNYQTEQFAFIDEESEESEEVIDWLKFSESRTERREEAKRRTKNRKIGLILLVVLAMLGGVGYLWQSGKLPGVGDSKDTAASAGGAQKRDVIVVHLMPVDKGPSATALLVDNTTKHRGTTVLLPNSLNVTTEDGTATTLDKAVADGVGPTRDALNSLLGSDIKGTWRLDTPYLELLVDSLGDVFVDTDTAVKGTGKDKDKTLVQQGKQTELTGQQAVAYATYLAPGEAQIKQLSRFGQVMQAVLKKMPSDALSATKTVQALAQILDPSLTDKQLGASLAQLAELAKTGAYDTAMLPVQKDGTLSAQTSDSVVKDILGGTVKKSDASAQARVLIKDASGDKKNGPLAQAAIVNGGTYTYVPGGTGSTSQAASQVVYADPARLAAAKDVASTLGLPASAVKKGTVPATADIAVTLGKDYKPSTG
ncbi:LCP family glycopolymer transferase [Actinacidiphila alni]|uniref:LCP family glycopolymer transferase n=1 Tax=Actinacidiphila alni TaxID=380248 RepID=UPI00345124BB